MSWWKYCDIKQVPNLETTLELKFKVTEPKCKTTPTLHGHNTTVGSNKKQHRHNTQLKVHSNSFCPEAADTLEALLTSDSCSERWVSCSQPQGDSGSSNSHTQWQKPWNHAQCPQRIHPFVSAQSDGQVDLLLCSLFPTLMGQRTGQLQSRNRYL